MLNYVSKSIVCMFVWGHSCNDLIQRSSCSCDSAGTFMAWVMKPRILKWVNVRNEMYIKVWFKHLLEEVTVETLADGQY